MLLELLYGVLKLEPYTKWHFIKRLKTRFEVRKIKKQIKAIIYDNENLFGVITDFCTFMEHAKNDLHIDIDNYLCDRIYYDMYSHRYTYILRFSIEDTNNTKFNVKLTYRTPEPNRVTITIISDKESLVKDVMYNLYIERGKNGSYVLDIYKKQFIDNMLNYMYSKLDTVIDDILKQYVYIRKERLNEDKDIIDTNISQNIPEDVQKEI